MPSLASARCPLYLDDLYEGACFLSQRLGISRLLIVSADGHPVATFELTPTGAGRIDYPKPRPTDPAANVALILFAQIHMRRETRSRAGSARGTR